MAGCAAPLVAAPTATSQITPVSPTPAVGTTPALSATEIAKETEISISIAEIRILSPGPGSLLRSPIRLQAHLQPGADGHLLAELSDAGGRLLVRQVLAPDELQVALELPFEISQTSLPAQLTLRTLDAYGRTQALSSVSLVLLSEGAANYRPASAGPQLQLALPLDGQSLPADGLLVRGQLAAQPSRPLQVKLITRQGRILAAREVYPQEDPSGQWLFELNLSVQVNEPTWVQVAVSAYELPAAGPALFAGVEVLLLP